jgi:hypothetical protein
MQKPIITILLLIVCLTIATKVKSFIKNNQPTHPAPVEMVEETETIICTMDAMMCPDGTYVGRSGLKCEFVCPEVSTTTAETIDSTVKLGETFSFEDLSFRVVAIIEDSRCPSDAQCIQAGLVKIVVDAGSTNTEMEVGQTIVADNKTLTLNQVTPYPTSTYRTQDDEYRFSFIIKSQ